MNKRFFKTPEFLSLPIFGLSITQSSIKLVKMKHSKDGRVPEFFDSVELPESCDYFTNQNSTNSPEVFKKALIELKNKYNIAFVHASVSENQTYICKMPVPQEAVEMIDTFIINNIDQYIPLSGGEIYFDYKILKSSHLQNAQVSVVVSAIPKNIVEKFSNFFESCGICMIGCEPETHALARCVVDKGDNNPYILIHIDALGTRISVIEEGFAQYTQTLSVSTKDIQGSISQETAQTLKDTINRVIIYWFTSQDHAVQPKKIENVLLSGLGVDSPEFINFFESNLAVNATHANVWKNCFDISTYIPEISKKDSLAYAVAIGLSLFTVK